jgi:acetyl esterase/lipase
MASGPLRRPPVALLLAVLSAAGAVAIVAPMPTFPLWLVHVAALETSLATTLVAALALGARRAAPPRARRAAAYLAVPSAVIGLAPLLAVAPAYGRTSQWFSIREYASGVAVADVRREEDLLVDPASPLLSADVFRGAGSGPRPFVVVVHGGSWRSGDKGEAPWISRTLAASGLTVVDVRYRLAPANRFPTAVGDVKCLLGRLRERAEAFGIDPRRAALLGRSAGGQIALVAAYSAGDPRVAPTCETSDEPVQAVVGLYAPTDLAWGYDNHARPDVVRGPESYRAYLGGTPAERPEAYRLGSPQSWADRPLPRTLLIHGTLDRLVRAEHSRRLARVLEAEGRSVQLLLIPLAEHAFDRRPGGVGEQLARATIVDFLKML